MAVQAICLFLFILTYIIRNFWFITLVSMFSRVVNGIVIFSTNYIGIFIFCHRLLFFHSRSPPWGTWTKSSFGWSIFCFRIHVGSNDWFYIICNRGIHISIHNIYYTFYYVLILYQSNRFITKLIKIWNWNVRD